MCSNALTTFLEGQASRESITLVPILPPITINRPRSADDARSQYGKESSNEPLLHLDVKPMQAWSNDDEDGVNKSDETYDAEDGACTVGEERLIRLRE